MIAAIRHKPLVPDGSKDCVRDAEVLLMERVRDDDAGAFEELMRRYRVRLEHLFARRSGSRDGADDFVQEVFLRVWQARKSYVASARFSTWLYTIAHHTSSNVLRTRMRRREVLLGSDNRNWNATNGIEALASDVKPGPSLEVLNSELHDYVRRVVECLHPRQRRVVLLKLDNMSYQEMAKCLRVSHDAIKALLARSRADLRRRLKPYIVNGNVPHTLPRKRFHTSRDPLCKRTA